MVIACQWQSHGFVTVLCSTELSRLFPLKIFFVVTNDDDDDDGDDDNDDDDDDDEYARRSRDVQMSSIQFRIAAALTFTDAFCRA